MHYLDNAATTQVSALAAQTAADILVRHWANPSALYKPGAQSEQVLSAARADVAARLGCTAGEIVFTACGSESNNLAILGAVHARRAWSSHIVVTGFEHPSVQQPVAALEKDGFTVTVVQPDAEGHVDMEAMINAVTRQTALVCCMHVNNEIGALQDVAALAAAVKQINSRTAVHVDGVQAWCKQPVRLADTQIDTYSVSGHKIHAPKGVGALYLRKGFHILPPYLGGGQERGLRPGTENIAFIAAMAAAAKETQGAYKANAQRIAQELNAPLRAALAQMPDITFNSPPDAVADILNFSVKNIKSETMLHYLESKDIYVSSGSACSKGAASHTLGAMGLDKSRTDTAVRVSFSTASTAADVQALIGALQSGLQEIAKIR